MATLWKESLLLLKSFTEFTGTVLQLLICGGVVLVGADAQSQSLVLNKTSFRLMSVFLPSFPGIAVSGLQTQLGS